ncbi:unnamed protein product [Linum trigynum]|uniref:Uncharacterized protein n=1 Tax=Linum trigynum TaxID=586398 RepID=A0AAV2G8I6_9ROSI
MLTSLQHHPGIPSIVTVAVERRVDIYSGPLLWIRIIVDVRHHRLCSCYQSPNNEDAKRNGCEKILFSIQVSINNAAKF